MSDVISVDPFCCRMWDRHARLEEHINEETCRAEIESFRLHGQLLPALARAIKGDPLHKYELIYGARRLFVARYLNVPLLIETKELTDLEAIVALDIENRQRQEISPYERGLSYMDWLRNGLFSSQDELARALNVSASQVSRLIRLSQLPPVILNAFPSPLEICESWGRALMDIWEDPSKKPTLIAAARAIARDEQPKTAVSSFQRLIASVSEPRRRGTSFQADCHDEVVKDHEGKPLFRVRQHRKDTALLLPTMSVSATTLSEIIDGVSDILQRARAQLSEMPTLHAAGSVSEVSLGSKSRREGGVTLDS